MTDELNGAEPIPEGHPASPRTATLSIAKTIAQGADPEGREAAIQVDSISGQAVRLHFPSIEVLADFELAVRAALNMMRQAARSRAGEGEEITCAQSVGNYSVGRVAGMPGVLLIIDPDTPHEAAYAFPTPIAGSAGKMLLDEAEKRAKVDRAISVGLPGKPGKLIMPSTKLHKPN